MYHRFQLWISFSFWIPTSAGPLQVTTRLAVFWKWNTSQRCVFHRCDLSFTKRGQVWLAIIIHYYRNSDAKCPFEINRKRKKYEHPWTFLLIACYVCAFCFAFFFIFLFFCWSVTWSNCNKCGSMVGRAEERIMRTSPECVRKPPGQISNVGLFVFYFS